MIDLRPVQGIINEAQEICRRLQGVELNERHAIADSSKGEARKQRAALSQQLNQLADSLELAATLVRNEYWISRGARDHVRQPQE